MQAITNTLKAVLDWIYTIISNYGWSIVIFTVLMKAALLPLDIKSSRACVKCSASSPNSTRCKRSMPTTNRPQQKQLSDAQERYNPLSLPAHADPDADPVC